MSQGVICERHSHYRKHLIGQISVLCRMSHQYFALDFSSETTAHFKS